MKQYSFLIGLQKFGKYFIIFALPVLVDKFIIAFPDIAQLSLGGLLVMFTNYLKVKAGK